MKRLIAALLFTAVLWAALLLSPIARAQGFQQYCFNSAWTSGLNQWIPCPTIVNLTGNATGTTGAVVGTLAAAAAKTTYLCGFVISAVGGTATIGPITVAGLVGGSAVYYLTSSVAGASLAETFQPCIPASAQNVAITITTTADGTASAVTVNSWGVQQ